jgi:CubicO group peptidase (beta-lactamase class C family)
MTGTVEAEASELEAALAWFVKDNRLAGAAAGTIHQDRLIWSGGAGFAQIADRRPADTATLYRIASITKTFTGTAVMQLRDEGALTLDEPAAKYLTEMCEIALPQLEIEAVTIRRMLAHESGLASEPPGTDWTVPLYEGIAAKTLQRIAEVATRIPPNLQQKYSNLAYQLLGEIVSRVSGVSYAQYVAANVLEPLGMATTSFDPAADALEDLSAAGYAPRAFSDELERAALTPPLWAEGGLWSSVTDLARWVSFQMSAYGPHGMLTPVLAPASLREMHTPRYLGTADWTQAWGLSWYGMRRQSVVWIQHSGGLPGFSTNVCFDPGSQVGAIVLVNGSCDASALAMDLAAISRHAVRSRPPVIEAPTQTPPAFRPLLGLYARAAQGQVVRLEWRDGQLTFIDPEEPGWQPTLMPTGDPATFVVGPGYRQSGEPVIFRRLPDGRVHSVFLADGTLRRLDYVEPVDQEAGR